MELEQIVLDPEERWWTGKVNRSPVVLEGQPLPESVALVDSTLREGADAPNAALSLDDRFRLADLLEEAGFREMEVGYVSIPAQVEFVRQLRRRNPSLRLHALARAYIKEGEWQAEIDRAVDAGVHLIRFVAFGSASLHAATPWLRPEDVPRRVHDAISYARGKGAATNVTVSGLVTVDLGRVWSVYSAAAEAGTDRVMIGDGIGGASPETFRFMARFIRTAIGPGPMITLHCHNTLGLATANALSGVLAGARAVDVVPLGLGDSSGITATEQLVPALEVLYGVNTGIDLAKIPSLCRAVAEAFRVPIAPNSPVVGTNVYYHQNDNHIASILRGGWRSWELINPATFGLERTLELAAGMVRSGRTGTLDAVLSLMGKEVSDEQFASLFQEVDRRARAKGRISVDEIRALAEEMI